MCLFLFLSASLNFIIYSMRIGETLALKKNDADFDSRSIYINNSLTRNKEDKTIIGKTTKTKNSKRIITINSTIENILNDSLKDFVDNEYNIKKA